MIESFLRDTGNITALLVDTNKAAMERLRLLAPPAGPELDELINDG